MAALGKILGIGAAAVLLLAATTPVALGQAVGGGSSFGGGSRGFIKIKGKVICAGCTLDEVRAAQPNSHDLYELTHRRGQMVMEVNEVNNSGMWDLAWPPRLAVRSRDSLFNQLIAEENMFKEVQITGVVRSTRTLDIFEVTFG